MRASDTPSSTSEILTSRLIGAGPGGTDLPGVPLIDPVVEPQPEATQSKSASTLTTKSTPADEQLPRKPPPPGEPPAVLSDQFYIPTKSPPKPKASGLPSEASPNHQPQPPHPPPEVPYKKSPSVPEPKPVQSKQRPKPKPPVPPFYVPKTLPYHLDPNLKLHHHLAHPTNTMQIFRRLHNNCIRLLPKELASDKMKYGSQKRWRPMSIWARH